MIVLASGSPRRRELLGALYPLVVRPVDIDETPRPAEDPVVYARRMAEEKGQACPVLDHVVVAADTVVHRGGAIYGKPTDAEDAVRMLLELSDKEHTVTTGTYVRFDGHHQVDATSTRVRFRRLTEVEVRGYVATGEPMDKAGGYGIQGLGGALVKEIEGSHSNVIGLPLAEVIAALVRCGAGAPFEHL